jgi:hypothetical protein
MKRWGLALWALAAATARAAGPESFSIVVLPDTQKYSDQYPATFEAQTAWVVSNREAFNIRFVTHLGDIVEHTGATNEWERADRAMDRLDGHVPYGACMGNHDVDPLYLHLFGPARYTNYPWYVGASSNGLNHAQRFEAGSQRFLHLTLEYGVPDPALAWARSVLAAHPDVPTVISTHDALGLVWRNPPGQRIHDELVMKFPQVFLVLNGHTHGEFQQVGTNAVGRGVAELLSDYQNGPEGGGGRLRILRFEPASNRIEVLTYTPTLNAYERDADSQFTYAATFTNGVDILGRLAEPAPLR